MSDCVNSQVLDFIKKKAKQNPVSGLDMDPLVNVHTPVCAHTHILKCTDESHRVHAHT